MIRWLFFLFVFLFISNLGANQVRYSGDKTKFNNKTGQIDLIGRAKVVDKKNILTANKIELFNKKKIAIAIGQVSLVNEEKKVTYTGERLRYDYGNKKLYCDSRSKVVNKKDKFTLEADKMTSYLETDITEAFSNVHMKSYKEENKLTEFFGDIGVYDSKKSIANLIGNSKIVDSNLTSYSEELIYYEEEKKVLLISNVLINSYEENATNNIKAQLVDYRFLSNEEFYCFTNVELYDNENSNIIYSQVLEYYPDSKYTYVTDNPKLVNQNKNVTVTGDIFERFEFEKILYIKGNVEIISRKQKANSSLALYWLDTEEILLYGIPSITTQRKGLLYAETIRFDMDKQFFRMEGQILGNLGK